MKIIKVNPQDAKAVKKAAKKMARISARGHDVPKAQVKAFAEQVIVQAATTGTDNEGFIYAHMIEGIPAWKNSSSTNTEDFDSALAIDYSIQKEA